MSNYSEQIDALFAFFKTKNLRQVTAVICGVALFNLSFRSYYSPYELNVARDLHDNNQKGKRKIVGFWHIGKSNYDTDISRDQFVMSQADRILNSFLFRNRNSKELNYDLSLNYVTREPLEKQTTEFLDSTGVIHELKPTALPMKDDVEYFEFPTLAEVHKYCQDPKNIDTEVFYIHTKTHDEWREAMENFVLGESCVKCLADEHNMACGLNHIQGWVWEHFSGNFWMTRCSHVAKLNVPFTDTLLEEALDSTHPLRVVPPFGRMFAEYWMLNDGGERKPRTKEFKQGLISSDRICSEQSEYSFHP